MGTTEQLTIGILLFWKPVHPLLCFNDHATIKISSNFTYLEPLPVESHVPVGELLDELDQSWHHSVEMVLYRER